MKTSVIGMIEWVLVLRQAPALSLWPDAWPQVRLRVTSANNNNAYPVIRMGHQDYVDWRRTWIARFENLWLIGRSGMVRYNNQDHAIATGLLAARTGRVLGRYAWRVNIDAEYRGSGAAA